MKEFGQQLCDRLIRFSINRRSLRANPDHTLIIYSYAIAPGIWLYQNLKF